MKRLAAVLLVLLGILPLTLTSAGIGVHAAPPADIVIESQPPVVEFPDGITFRASVRSSEPVVEATLHYEVHPDGSPAYARATLEGDTAEYHLAGNAPPRIYLWPGATIEYWWEVRDAGDNVRETEPATVVYQDTRFQWQRTERDGFVLWYYGSSADLAERFLEVGAALVDEVGALLAAQPDFPVNVFLYDSREDMLPALQRRGETFESQIITLGVRVSSDTVLVLNNAGAEDTLRHELTHVLTKVAGVGLYGDLPAWLDEGTAVYAQSNVDGYYSDALSDAIRTDKVLSLAGMRVPPGDPTKVGLFYGQSGDVVRYLIEEEPGGREKFPRLFAELKRGQTLDEALEAVYGYDLRGLEDRWREHVGLAPRSEEPRDEPRAERPRESTESEDDGGLVSRRVLLVGGILAVSVLAASGILGGTIYYTRRGG